MEISPKEYPEDRTWDEKVFSMPNIPRGSEGLLYVLRDILTKVRSHNPPNDILNYDGSSSKITLNEACVRLRPMHLVLRTQNGWEISKESERWLDSGDDLYLAALLCANIRFVAEVLCYLDIPRKAAELNEIAARDYGLEWKTKSDIGARLTWLQQFGLVDFQKFSLSYSVTEKGKDFLKNVHVVESNQLLHQEDDTYNENSIEIKPWIKEYCELDQQQLSTRKQSIGYIPGNISDCCNTITEYLRLIQTHTDYGAIRHYAKENYGVAPSSIRSFMSTLTNLDFIKRQTDQLYVLTEPADKWLRNCSTVELICCIHKKFLYVLELLSELNGQVLGYKELLAIGQVSYGLDKISVEEIRKRVSILKSANLVRNISRDKFTITKRGQLLLGEFSLQERRIQNTANNQKNGPPTSSPDALFTELRLAAKDSMNPDRFEYAIKSAFEALGFAATRLGGSGKTDVLIHTPGSSKTSFSVAVDAKSTASDSVSDAQIDFDTLEEHRKKHCADYSAVVGCAFRNERLIKRAIEHKVILLDVDHLELLIKRHLEVPIKLSFYRQIFEKPGIADTSLVDNNRQEIIAYGKLMHAVMNCLLSESEDPVTEGILQERDIYRSLRDCKETDEPPTTEAIRDMLHFLSSPLIGCVEKSKDGYYATGSLSDAARKFAFYARNCSR